MRTFGKLVVMMILVTFVVASGLAGFNTVSAQEEGKTYEQWLDQYDKWVSLKVYEKGRGVSYVVEDQKWQLPLESQMAHDLSSGWYEAVEPIDSNPDDGYCAAGQRDCTNHAWLWRIAIPSEFVGCTEAVMDIAHRVTVTTTCEDRLPMIVGLRYNDENVTGDVGDEPEHWGLTQSELAVEYDRMYEGREAGLFLSTMLPEFAAAQVITPDLDNPIGFQYACWDCVPDTSGPAGDIVQLDPAVLSHTGEPQSAPLGHTDLPGVVVPLPREWDWVFTSVVLLPEIGAEDMGIGMVIWLGEYVPDPTTAQ